MFAYAEDGTAPNLNLKALERLGVDAALIAKRERLDGRRALRFLADLPGLAASWQEQLGLRDARIMPGGVLSAALACSRVTDGLPVVLKLSAAHATSSRAEAAALAAWNGVGACGLLHAADDGAVLLLEAIRPGTAVRPDGEDGDDVAPLPGRDGEDARRAADLLAALHRVPPERIPSEIPDATHELHWRFERAHAHLDGPSHAGGLVSHAVIDEAHERALALHARSPRRVLCHGDFTNKNVLLDADRAWRAIDPRPCVGDPCLDAAFWSLTHRPGVHVKERCELVARARGLDAARVWAWAQAFAVSETVLVTDIVRARAHHRVLAGP